MPKNKTVTAQAPSVEQIYNLFMQEIEPELQTWALPMIAAKFVNDTDDERAERELRYQTAFRLFEERFGAALRGWEKELKAIRSKVLKDAEAQERARSTDSDSFAS